MAAVSWWVCEPDNYHADCGCRLVYCSSTEELAIAQDAEWDRWWLDRRVVPCIAIVV